MTTVLLVDNQKLNRDINSRNGRYLNVKPVIGLLTSTARTFIQDGVTTEYATEVVGTTLDNGRVYAQLLTKSSLVLYDRPLDGVQELTKRTRLPYEADAKKWNVEANLGDKVKDQYSYIIKNTDYITPKEGGDLFTVFASKPTQEYATAWNPAPVIEGRFGEEFVAPTGQEQQIPDDLRVQGLREIPRYSEFEAFNFLDPLPTARERKISAYNNINAEIVNKDEKIEKAVQVKDNLKETITNNVNQSQVKIIEPAKINPNIKLPTFTVKNEFSPIFYYIDNVEAKTEKSNAVPSYLKSAKKLFGFKEDFKPLKTFTYYGFANFTTTVGETVIVFSPSTASAFIKESEQEITKSIKPVLPNIASRLKTFLSSDLMITKTFGHPLQTARPEATQPLDAIRSSKALSNQIANLKNALFEKPKADEEQALIDDREKFNRVIASLKSGLFIRPATQFGLHKDVIQPSETSYSTIVRNHATDQINTQDETTREERIPEIQATEPLKFFRPTAVIETTDAEENSAFTEETFSTYEDEVTEEDETPSTTESFSETMANTEETLSTPQMEETSDDTESEAEAEAEEVEKEEEVSVDATCTDGIIPVSTMTTAYKTFTYLTTYFIPLEGTDTTTSVKSHEVVSTETGFLTNLQCKTSAVIDIMPTTALNMEIDPTISVRFETSTEKHVEMHRQEVVTEASLPILTTTENIPEVENVPVTTESAVTEAMEETTPEKATTPSTPEPTENRITTVDMPATEHITTSESHTEATITTDSSDIETTTQPKEIIENITESNENEIDLIYKTLYTTYTYFTTYFQGSTSTVASKKSVVTNVITSTLDLSEIDPSIFNAIESSDYLFKATAREQLGEIAPTSVGAGRPTQTYAINSILDLVQHKQVIDSAENDAILSSKIQTPELNDEKLLENINADVVKTFYTTYTFFTTLYVEEDMNICSRSEVYTNYVGPASLIPTKTSSATILKTDTNQIDFNNCKKVSADKIPVKQIEEEKEVIIEKVESVSSKSKKPLYSSIDRTNKKPATDDNNLSREESRNLENEIILQQGESMFVTDVKSSSSKGERQIIDNAILDDQISSESNIDEIIPSATLLLQTSYTTFTYFTTMYLGKDSSKVKSRLETVTNVVTETLDPKQTEVEASNLPITYYTTFTYWTTLYKDKTTTITSREDIISNVVAPSALPEPVTTPNPIATNPIDVSVIKLDVSKAEVVDNIKPSSTIGLEEAAEDDGKATFFTTYTYFTTYYVGNSSELRSSLETVTNIVDNTKDLVNENQLARAVGNQPPAGNLVGDGDKPVIKNTKMPDIIIVPTKFLGDNAIIQTQLVGTYSDNFIPGGENDKRIISSQVAVISGDSTIITNVEKPAQESNKVDSIQTTKLVNDVGGESTITNPGVTIIEGSVTDPTTLQSEEGEGGDDEDDEEETEDEDGNITRKKSRLTFQTRKRTFTPVIRPFVSRNRPTFNPKRASLTSATTVTRSDFTPTVTATPALKSAKSTGFGNRKASSSAYPGSSTGGGRRFSRISSSATANAPSQRSTGFRGRSSIGEIQPTNARRGGFRTSSARAGASELSSSRGGSRIRPTLSSRYRGNKQTTTPNNNDDLSTFVTEDPTGLTNYAETVTQSDGPVDLGFRRTTNSLLRFRRPPFTRAPSVTTPRTAAQGTTRRGAVNNRRAGTTTTPKPPTRTTQNPLFALRNRQRTNNSIFPPRGLINKQQESQPEEETNNEDVEENQDDLEGEELEDDTDYDSSNRQESQVTTTTLSPAARKIINTPVIKPFGFRRRTKRQVTDYGARRNFSNFRRPTTRPAKAEPKIDVEVVEVTTASRVRPASRYNNARSAGNKQTVASKQTPAKQQVKSTPKSVRTTSAPASGRQPFILRGESKTHQPTTRPGFRARASRTSGRSTSPTANLRPKAPRLKTYTSAQTEPTRTSRPSSRSRAATSRRGSTTRQRTTSNDIADNNYVNYQVKNDGKLTVTHKIPIEVTIPVVNGKLTEYKNVLTAKPSIEVLLPNQYSTTQNAFGSQYIALVSELSEPGDNGATKVVQFILHETPTTSVIFTPTTIRGRKTSFSHVIPSTVYDVERVTSTIQPQINANVPLANILLSQLLLGNIGMPQPQLNPFLALQGGQQQQLVQGTPTTEFKTRATTYVTTVTDAKSTVIPLTFRGKEIFTTIIDSKVDVITATEFITETIVVTPTLNAPNQNPNQLNSILLLLQQQQVQQQQVQQQQQTANPLLGFQNDLNLFQNQQQLLNNNVLSPKPEVLDISDPDDNLADISEESIEVVSTPSPRKIARRKPVVNKPVPPRESSVITLYVSGRHPGEFSTVLSTSYLDENPNIQKREAVYYEEYDLNPSDLPYLSRMVLGSQSDMMLDTYVMPAMDNTIIQDTTTQYETQSLESIIGEVSQYIRNNNPSSILETANSDATVTYVIKGSEIESGR